MSIHRVSVSESFSDCRSFDIEVIAARASGDLAYTVAFEHTTAAIHGGRPSAYVLRVTTVVHRHADSSASPIAGDALQRLASVPEVAN